MGKDSKAQGSKLKGGPTADVGLRLEVTIITFFPQTSSGDLFKPLPAERFAAFDRLIIQFFVWNLDSAYF